MTIQAPDEAETKAEPVALDSAELARLIREVVRSELRAERDRKSFAAASDMMTQKELVEYLPFSRTTILKMIAERRRAKTDEEKNAAFAPEHTFPVGPRYRRSEVDAWFDSYKK